MRKFTKSLMTLAMLFVGVGSVSAKTLAVDLSALPGTSEQTTWAWNTETSSGTFEWSATSYNSTELFGSGNYSAYTTLNYDITAGTADHFRVIFKFTNGTAQKTIYVSCSNEGSIDLTTEVGAADLAFVQTIRLSGANDVTGNVIVKSISLNGPDINYIEASEAYEAPAGTTDIKNLTGYSDNNVWTNSVVYPKELAVQGQAFGNGDGSNESEHVDIDAYDYIAFYIPQAADQSVALRVWIWDEVAGSVKTLYAHPIANYTDADFTQEHRISAAGTYVAKVTGYKYLKGVKAANNWGAPAVTVNMAWVGSGAPVAYVPSGKYTLVGESVGSASLEAALADANATSYDATGVTGTDVDLTKVANPNALFIAGEGVLANTNNVIINGTCANLVLTDGNPFKAVADFTATAATYTTTLNAVAKAGTLCLPFEATIPAEVEAYTLAFASSDAATATPVETTIPANTPVLLNGSGEQTFTGDGAVSASATNVSGALTGVFAATVVPADSYVLQNGAKGLGFYKVASSITANPFRAYLTAESGAPFISLDFGTVTAISQVEKAELGTQNIYDLQGRRVANPTKGLYIVNGKKVAIK